MADPDGASPSFYRHNPMPFPDTFTVQREDGSWHTILIDNRENGSASMPRQYGATFQEFITKEEECAWYEVGESVWRREIKAPNYDFVWVAACAMVKALGPIIHKISGKRIAFGATRFFEERSISIWLERIR